MKGKTDGLLMPLRYPFSSTLLNQSVPENRFSPSWSAAPLTWTKEWLTASGVPSLHTKIWLTRHGSSTHKMPAILPPIGLHLLVPGFHELQWLKMNILS